VKHKLASWWKTIKLTANLMAGVPDYENYVARQRKHNPNAPVMTELQFQDYCRKRRCGGNGGRCCEREEKKWRKKFFAGGPFIMEYQ